MDLTLEYSIITYKSLEQTWLLINSKNRRKKCHKQACLLAQKTNENICYLVFKDK